MPSPKALLEMWVYSGSERPPFALAPAPGQESVWDYPRPPRLAPDARRVEVIADGVAIATTTRALRLLETASPPSFYLPPQDIDLTRLRAAEGRSVCEWKGAAAYFSVLLAGVWTVVAWSYPAPAPRYAALRGYYGFYPGRVACFVNGEGVQPQAGGFYGGWITAEIVGPCKGGAGSAGW